MYILCKQFKDKINFYYFKMLMIKIIIRVLFNKHKINSQCFFKINYCFCVFLTLLQLRLANYYENPWLFRYPIAINSGKNTSAVENYVAFRLTLRNKEKSGFSGWKENSPCVTWQGSVTFRGDTWKLNLLHSSEKYN